MTSGTLDSGRVICAREFLADVVELFPGVRQFPFEAAECSRELESALSRRICVTAHSNKLSQFVSKVFDTRQPAIDVRNRVWMVNDPSHQLNLEGSMNNHRLLDTAVEQIVKLEWRGKRCLRVCNSDGSFLWLWLDSKCNYNGGLLIDFEYGYRGETYKCHAKMYHMSTSIQLFGCGHTPDEAMAAYRSLQQLMGKLYREYGKFASSKSVTTQDFRCINENSALNLYMRISHIEELCSALERDWIRYRDSESTSLYACIENIRRGRGRIYISVKGANSRAVVTLFSSGRGHVSARSSICRVLAWCVVLKIMVVYGVYFIDTYIARSARSSTDADASSAIRPLGSSMRSSSQPASGGAWRSSSRAAGSSSSFDASGAGLPQASTASAPSCPSPASARCGSPSAAAALAEL